MKTVNEKLVQIMNDNNLNVNSFAKKIGTSRPVMDNYIKLGRTPSLEVIIKILEEFPEIDANWLLRNKTNIDDYDDEYSYIDSTNTPNIYGTLIPFVAKNMLKLYCENYNDVDFIFTLPKISITQYVKEIHNQVGFEVPDNFMKNEGGVDSFSVGDIVVGVEVDFNKNFQMTPSTDLFVILIHKYTGFIFGKLKSVNKENIDVTYLNPIYFNDSLSINLKDINQLFIAVQAIKQLN